MRYLGSVTRRGALGTRSVPGTLEIECYARKGGDVMASGEIETRSSTLALFTSGAKIAFVTEDGHRLSLSLADPRSTPKGTIAQVLVTGDLPTIRNGLLDWPEPNASASAS